MSLFERVLETSEVLEFIALDGNGLVTAANPGFARGIGIPLDQLIGQSATRLLALPDSERVRAWNQGSAPLPAGRTAINFLRGGESPYTLSCLVEREENGALAILGEPDASDDRRATDQLMQVTNEMATLARENTRRRRELEETQRELTAALEELRTSYWHLQKIQEVIPICMQCGRVKADAANWQTLVQYLMSNQIFLSHGYCPDCAERVMREIDEM